MGSDNSHLPLGVGASNRKAGPQRMPTNMFLYAALLISLWQVSLFAGQHYYARYHRDPHPFNLTAYSLRLGRALEAGHNLTADLTSQLQALRFQARSLDQRATQSHRDLMRAAEFAALRIRALGDSNTILQANASQQVRRQEDLAQKVRLIEHKVELLQDANAQLQRELSALRSSSQTRVSTGSEFSRRVEFRALGLGDGLVGSWPSNSTSGRVLCVRGNGTTLDSYAVAPREGLPSGAVLLPGTTLVAASHRDFKKPWSSMYSLLGFVPWRMGSECGRADGLVLFQKWSLRTSMGYWIRNVVEAAGLPTRVEALGFDARPVCFERAVVNREGIDGVAEEELRRTFEEVRCTSRRMCKVTGFRSGPSREARVGLTLVVRSGPRDFADVGEWQRVLRSQCRSEVGCQFSTMFISNLTFCQQVEMMSRTDILVSVHGAPLTNMIFLSPGSRVMEVFPSGWEEFAGKGQFVYRQLSSWVGLKHEGFWRDQSGLPCPSNDTASCFSFYRDRPVGINQTFVSTWVRRVVDDFSHLQAQALLPPAQRKDPKFEFLWDKSSCHCS